MDYGGLLSDVWSMLDDLSLASETLVLTSMNLKEQYTEIIFLNSRNSKILGSLWTGRSYFGPSASMHFL